MVSSQTHDSYHVGIVCALAVEKAAIVAMLDEGHDRLRNINGDENDYTFGTICQHDVAVACLPAGSMGKSSAAIVAKDMMRSFPIKICLMVGVGGGVGGTRSDVRLGDVVVSQPDGRHGGVVQWDFGKMESSGIFRRTGALNNPPKVLLNALQTLKTKHMMYGDNLPEHLAKMSSRIPYMAEVFQHQGIDNDRLFQSTYVHRGGETCDSCSASKIIARLPPRINTRPKIHYGNIASGDEVVKDSRTRDRIANEEGVICFEMEAAGLMNNFPCLVIRGICDYADSHKNKRWQPYAAAVAAAYAKELLGVIEKEDIDKTKQAGPQMPASRHVPQSTIVTFGDNNRGFQLGHMSGSNSTFNIHNS